ncbi:MAG TPA: hypothetical protein DGR97_02820 [Gammaproteobacteria bacterium]|nr:hypothetical protein [Gammaproteobacteria bacterium]|tara:strand:+ start:876 stop:2141 length:1266 start_codon:yes stop_codon:yes gene_type:complete
MISTLTQAFGIAIVLLALGQLFAIIKEMMISLAAAKQQTELELAVLKLKVEEHTLRLQGKREKLAAGWSGIRKFTVAKRVDEGGEICSFYLKPHDGRPIPSFDSGQYLTFELKVPGKGKPVTRCYSLSDSALNDDHYRVSIKRAGAPPTNPDAPPGVASDHFHQRINEGDIVDVKAPAGNFCLDLSKTNPIVLIGGGVGVTPMLSMLNTLVDSGSRREVWFFYGVRHGNEQIMKAHLSGLAAQYDNLRLCICYSEPREEEQEGVDYTYGERVSVDLFKRVLPANNFEFYICGPPPMMESITDGLKEWGVPEGDIYFEAFGPASVKKKASKDVDEKGQTYEIAFDRSGKKVVWNDSTTSILELAEDSDVIMDFGCRAGSCGSCVVAIKSGSVDYISAPSASTDGGTCLSCLAIPKSDLVLDA